MKTNRPFYFMLFSLLISSGLSAQIFTEDFNSTGDLGNTYTMETIADGTNIPSFVRSIVSGRRHNYIINTELVNLTSQGIDSRPDNHDGSKAISFANPVSAYNQYITVKDANFDEGVALTTQSIDISSFQDLNIGLKVASTNGERNQYAVDEGLDIQYELDNSGIWVTVGSFRGRGVSPYFSSPYYYLYEDTDLDGTIGTVDVQEGPVGPDFKEVSYNVDERAGTAITGRTIRLRIAFYSESEGEGSFDDLVLTGTPRPPSISTINVTDASCPTESDGAITASIDFGAPQFDYYWTGGRINSTRFTEDTSVTATGLKAGTYTLRVIDDNNDEDQVTIIVGVAPDVENPVIGTIADRTQFADESCSSVLLDYRSLASTSDNCDQSLSITQIPTAGSIISGTTPVTITSTDDAGNSTSTTFNVTIIDDMDPVIGRVVNQTQETGESCSTKLADYTALALVSDNCDDSPVVTQSPVAGTNISKTTIVTLTVTDASGNSASTTFNVSLMDVIAPKIQGSAFFSLENQTLIVDESCSVELLDYTGFVNVSDNCDGSPVVKQSPEAFKEVGVGIVAVTLTATDASGNNSEVTFDVTVKDNENPVIECPSDLEIESSEQLVVTYNAPDVTENCTVDEVILTSGLESGSIFPFGTTVQEYKVSDASGNIGTCSFSVTVDQITGINDKVVASQLFFPNPSNGVLSFSGETPDKIIVKQLDGTLVTEIDQVQNPVVLESLPTSVYLLEVYTNGKVDFHKISIVK